MERRAEKQKEKEAKPKDAKGKGPTNKTFYPVYQKVMLRVVMEFVMRMKEEKEPTLYKTYISLVINNVGAVDTSVQDTTVNDVWQTIKDKKCTYITEEDDEESEEEDLIGARDIEKTFKSEEMTAEVKDQIAECFEEMSKAHEAIKKVYKSAAKLIPKLSSKGMGVFLEALALETPDILDTRVANILQDARLNRRLCEEVKTFDNTILFNKCKEMQKNRMLPDWMHPIFKQKAKYWPVGKIAAAVTVFLRYAMGEKAKDVTLTTIGELFPIGERQARKVAMGKLYDTKGKCIEDLFLKMGRAYEGDPIDWKQEAAVPKTRYFPHTADESEGSKEHDTLEALDTSEEKVITRVIGMAIKEEPKDENIPARTRRFTRSYS